MTIGLSVLAAAALIIQPGVEADDGELPTYASLAELGEAFGLSLEPAPFGELAAYCQSLPPNSARTVSGGLARPEAIASGPLLLTRQLETLPDSIPYVEQRLKDDRTFAGLADAIARIRVVREPSPEDCAQHDAIVASSGMPPRDADEPCLTYEAIDDFEAPYVESGRRQPSVTSPTISLTISLVDIVDARTGERVGGDHLAIFHSADDEAQLTCTSPGSVYDAFRGSP